MRDRAYSRTKEFVELGACYQFANDFVVDDTAFRSTFDGSITAWDDIVERTVAYYRVAR